LASSVFLAVSLLTAICAATVIGQSTTTSVASATGISYQSLGYPWEDATPLVNTPKDFEAGYTTCPNDDQNCFERKYNGYGESDPWGYYLRNCTSYVAWLLSQDGVPTKYFDFASYAKGDAESWLADAQSPQWSALNGATGSTPEDDAVAVSVPDDHVMFVTSTDPANSPPGDITVEEYNQNQGGPNAGEGDIRTDTPADLDITGYIYYGRYIPGPPTNPSPSPAPPTAKARWAGFEFRDSSEPDVAAAFSVGGHRGGHRGGLRGGEIRVALPIRDTTGLC
jgi:surface antigen